MSKSDPPITQQQRDFSGVLALLSGAGILVIGAGLVPRFLDNLQAPLWIGLAAGGVFALAGVSMLLQGRVPAWVSGLITNLLLTLIAAIPAWIAWGKGQREFSGSGIDLAWLLGFDDQSVGRVAFSISAIVMLAYAAVVWLRWFAAFERKALFAILPGLALAGYVLFVMIPAEPDWPDIHGDHERLSRYALLAAQEGWTGHPGNAPASWRYPPWRNFEHWIKATRGRLASARTAPPGATIKTIPIQGTQPVVDGRIGGAEWLDALKIDLAPESLGSAVWLTTNGKFLYVAADALGDSTEDGYDQFRFMFHINLSPSFANELVSVGRYGGANALRTLRLPPKGGTYGTRSDWHIFERVKGSTQFAGHRQYELEIDLQEAGITPGVPFAAGFSIEGDPVLNEKGKFKARSYLGTAGLHGGPVWLVIEK